MKRLLTTILLGCLCLLPINSWATSGFFTGPDAAFIVYDVDGGGNTFTDADNTLSGSPIDLGIINTLLLNGGETKTFKNSGDDITAVRIMYRVYPTGSVSGTFSPVTLFFLENCNTGTSSFPSGGGCGSVDDQKWQTTAQNVDILAGLAQDTGHTLEFYFEADFTFTGGGGGSGTHFYSNGGANYALTFTTFKGVPTLSEWGLIILALLFMTFGTLYIIQVQTKEA